MTDQRHGVSPVAALSGILFLVGLWLLAQVFWPATAESLLWLDLALAVIVLVLAAASLMGRRHFGDWWVLVVLLAGNAMVACSTFADPTALGQIINGFFLLMITVFAAYFLARRAFSLVLVTGVGGYSAGLILNPKLDVISYALLINVLVVAVAVAVAYQATLVRALVQEDPLTGALNRRGLELVAPRARAHADREGKPTTVMVIDLDGFKRLNDERGHRHGDHVLATAVQDWTTVLRRGDVLARIGGDEFVVVLPGMSLEDARTFAERLRELNHIAWTFGCALWGPKDDLSSALNAADRVMYSRKPHRR